MTEKEEATKRLIVAAVRNSPSFKKKVHPADAAVREKQPCRGCGVDLSEGGVRLPPPNRLCERCGG